MVDNKDKEKTSIDLKMTRRLLVFLKPYRKYVIWGLLISLLTSLLSPVRPYLAKIAVDDYIAGNDLTGLIGISALIFGVLALNGFLMFFMTYMMQKTGQKVLLDLRMTVFDKIRKLSFTYYDKNPVGKLVTRVTNDVEALNELFSSGVVMIIADLLLLGWIVGFMFFLNAELALLTLSVLPVLLIATYIFKTKVRYVFRDVRLKLASMNSFLNEYFSGISAVKLFAAEEESNRKFDGINAGYRESMVLTVFYHAVFYPVVELVSACAVGIILWYSGVNILDGLVTAGTLIAFLQYGEMFFRPVRDLTEKFTTLQSAMASSERIFELLDTESDAPDRDEGIELEGFKDKIEFKNVYFSYDGTKQVLRNLSLEVKKGETVAIVGATGAGKTSVISLLSGFYDYQSGEITVDGIDLKKIKRNSLLRHTAIVRQDVFLFTRSVADNISMGNPAIGEAKIKEAAEALGADGFISALSEGYSSNVNERGSTLSAGQRQLLSFCRAYACNPDILILDEATSNIDTATEQIIEKSLEKLLEGRTSIVIAHRLSTVKRADRIIVLHRGEVKETGTHSELLEKGGIYSKLYRLQYNQISA